MSGFGPQQQSGPPDSLPATPAPIDFGLDRIEAMNTMMAINRQLGSLQTSVEVVNRDIRDLRDRDIAELKDTVKKQGDKLSGIDKKIYAALAIIGILGFLLAPAVTFFLGKVFGTK